MGNSEGERTPDLDQVRQMLFPNLTEDEGWARIEQAISGAADPVRWEAIERLAAPSLGDDLLLRLNELREDQNGDAAGFD